jgi:hypothetical protein
MTRQGEARAAARAGDDQLIRIAVVGLFVIALFGTLSLDRARRSG